MLEEHYPKAALIKFMQIVLQKTPPGGGGLGMPRWRGDDGTNGRFASPPKKQWFKNMMKTYENRLKDILQKHLSVAGTHICGASKSSRSEEESTIKTSKPLEKLEKKDTSKLWTCLCLSYTFLGFRMI